MSKSADKAASKVNQSGLRATLRLKYAFLTKRRYSVPLIAKFSSFKFIPFDQSVEFHKLAAYVGAFLSVIHVVGHFLNFYLLAEAPFQAASCVLPQVFTDEESEKSFFQLLFTSHQGITGLLLVLVMSIIYSFAAAQSRRKRHKVFWKTHMLYPLFFLLLSLHGLQALLQEPKFIFYLLGPGIIFLIDKTIELRRSYVEGTVFKSGIL